MGGAVVGLDVGLRVVGLDVGLRVVGLDDPDVGPHDPPFSEMRTRAKAGELAKSMLRTLMIMFLPEIAPLHLPPAPNFATNSVPE